MSLSEFLENRTRTFSLVWGTFTGSYVMSELSSLIGRFPTAGLLLLLVLGALGLPFPEDTTLILCGFLIQTGVVRPVPVLVAVYVLLVAIDFAIFWTGRKYGHAIVTHRKFRRIISEERLSALEQKVRKWGVLLILLGRHVVGLRIQLVIATGVFRMPPLKFLIADAVTIPVTMAFMVGLGYAGSNSLQIVRRDISRVEHLAVLLAIAVIVVYLFVRAFKPRKP
jgi:membrane protein DedA with SNARE-associated domain